MVDPALSCNLNPYFLIRESSWKVLQLRFIVCAEEPAFNINVLEVRQ